MHVGKFHHEMFHFNLVAIRDVDYLVCTIFLHKIIALK